MHISDRHRRLVEERDSISAAQDRLLAGTPQRSLGELTVRGLAAEAGLSRARLYEHHSDLIEQFRGRIGRGAVSPNVAALQTAPPRRDEAHPRTRAKRATTQGTGHDPMRGDHRADAELDPGQRAGVPLAVGSRRGCLTTGPRHRPCPRSPRARGDRRVGCGNRPASSMMVEQDAVLAASPAGHVPGPRPSDRPDWQPRPSVGTPQGDSIGATRVR